ncbi:MAG TPA: ABC transporter ATP-binding protein [Anaerovoracaceae bacterium]|nr:ABC transporter ATP-binding protein [Anaerovoracaceae bacterium]
MLKGNNIYKDYGKQSVLKNVDFVVSKKEIVGLSGINGSGKTTLLDVLALILNPDKGEIVIDSDYVSDKNKLELRKKIAYVPQDIALFEELTVKENLLCWSKLNKDSSMKRIKEIEPYFNLEKMFNKKIIKLSGGMKRRVNFAVALMGEYEYMVLDEPLAGLDYESADDLIEFIKNERDKGIGIILTGHERYLLSECADRIIDLEAING